MIIFTPNSVIKSADMNTNFADILEVIYPVGSIYTATVSTNPATLLGFGTWTAFADGKVLVGKAASGTFNTGGATGGAETHTLTTAEMPSHRHTNVQVLNNAAGGSGATAGHATNGGASGSSEAASLLGLTGGGGAHNNLQPYIVVYMWERTL